MENSGEGRSTQTPIATGGSGPGKSAANANAGRSEKSVRFTRQEIEEILQERIGARAKHVDWNVLPDTFEPISATVRI